jgi:hypothetical protein
VSPRTSLNNILPGVHRRLICFGYLGLCKLMSLMAGVRFRASRALNCKPCAPAVPPRSPAKFLIGSPLR